MTTLQPVDQFLLEKCLSVIMLWLLTLSQLFPALPANMAAGPDPPLPTPTPHPTAEEPTGAVATFSNAHLCCGSLGQGRPLEQRASLTHGSTALNFDLSMFQ